MAQFSIFGKNLTPAEIEAAQGLVKAAAGNPADVAVIAEIGPPNPNADNEVIVVLGTPAVCADPALADDFTKAANGARRAIWVWPEGSEATEVPAAAKNYCYSYLPWSADKLKATAADDDVTCFETGAGAPVPTVETERNLCAVEAEAKVKEVKPK